MRNLDPTIHHPLTGPLPYTYIAVSKLLTCILVENQIYQLKYISYEQFLLPLVL